MNDSRVSVLFPASEGRLSNNVVKARSRPAAARIPISGRKLPEMNAKIRLIKDSRFAAVTEEGGVLF